MKIDQYHPTFDRPALAEELAHYAAGDGYFTEYKKTQENQEQCKEKISAKGGSALGGKKRA